jgi:hypothetical protein
MGEGKSREGEDAALVVVAGKAERGTPGGLVHGENVALAIRRGERRCSWSVPCRGRGLARLACARIPLRVAAELCSRGRNTRERVEREERSQTAFE